MGRLSHGILTEPAVFEKIARLEFVFVLFCASAVKVVDVDRKLPRRFPCSQKLQSAFSVLIWLPGALTPVILFLEPQPAIIPHCGGQPRQTAAAG